MLILIPMAGFGDRYLRAGYTEPKPLIPVANKPMIERVIEAFEPRQADDRYLFVVNREHAETTDLVPTLERLVPDAAIAVIEPHKDGPIATLLAAEAHIDADEEVILNYCDFGVDWSYVEFRRWLQEHAWDGAMSAYRGFHPHSLGPTLYAYMRVADDQQSVLEIREKHHFTENKFEEFASSGLYYFRSAKLMFDSARAVMQGERVQNEFYVSMAMQKLIENGLRVGVTPLKHFYQWGTPADLRDWESWASAMGQLEAHLERSRQVELRAALVVPMAGLGKRFADRGYTDPKPLIDVAGEPMIARVLQMLPNAPSRALIALAAHAGDPRLQQVVAQAGARLELLDEVTDGQATTAAVGARGVPADQPVLFAPCDTGCLFDPAELAAIEADGSADLVVFTARGHLPALWRPHYYGWMAGKDGWASHCAVKKHIEGIPVEQQEVVVGSFWFASRALFDQEYAALRADDDRVNGELYLDTIARRMIERGARVRMLSVDKYVPWGTPEEYETFRYWNEVFRQGRSL